MESHIIITMNKLTVYGLVAPSVFLSTSKFIFRGCHVHDRIVVGFKVPITTKVMSSNPVHDEVLHDKVCH
jgi:hypothetical protein